MLEGAEDFEDGDEVERWLTTTSLSLDYVKVGRLVEWKLKTLLRKLAKEGCEISYSRAPKLTSVWYVNLTLTGSMNQIDYFERTMQRFHRDWADDDEETS